MLSRAARWGNRDTKRNCAVGKLIGGTGGRKSGDRDEKERRGRSASRRSSALIAETAKASHVRFQSIKATEYFVQVIAPGYQTAVKQVEARKDETRQVTIELRELSVEDVAENAAYRALAPKAQKEIGKALERLRAQKLDDARSHLDAANRAAPNQAEVQ